MLLDEQIVAIERAFREADIPHAFGGAQALAYYGDIRATHDIDVNVFVAPSEAPRVLSVLGELGAATANPGLQALIERDGQVRILWDDTPIDLFFAYDALHHSSLQRRRRVDFYGDPIHILSPEDLMTYKATFNRDKDWQDIAGIIYACEEALDFDYVRRWLGRIDSKGVAPGAAREADRLGGARRRSVSVASLASDPSSDGPTALHRPRSGSGPWPTRLAGCGRARPGPRRRTRRRPSRRSDPGSKGRRACVRRRTRARAGSPSRRACRRPSRRRTGRRRRR